MAKALRQKSGSSSRARWFVLAMVSATMFCGYFICDVMAPLKGLLEQNFGWTSVDFGFFNSAYGWLNAVLLMLIVSGVILDRMGPRFTGILAVGIMLAGVALKYYAITAIGPGIRINIPLLGEFKRQLLTASLGYAVFAWGYEMFGITASKIIVRWFRGREMALALGLNIAFARLGTFLAISTPILIAEYFGSISAPILFSMTLLAVGFLTFILFVRLDSRLDGEAAQEATGDDEKFRVSDIFSIFKVRGFWYIAILCLLFYSGVFPFLKFATEFMIVKFNVEPRFAGAIPSLLPFGTLLLTPLFGGIYDKKGYGATIMLIGAVLLVFVYSIFAIRGLDLWLVAVGMMLVLGVAFSLVPSAMWPSVAKIMPLSKLGTAYALIFWFQNWGLAGVPLLVGWVLDKYGRVDAGGVQSYDYTLPILIFLILSSVAVLFAVLLKREDRIKGYGLQQPNIQKQLQ